MGCVNPTIVHSSDMLFSEAHANITIDSTIPFLAETDSNFIFQSIKDGKNSLFLADEFCYDSIQNNLWFRSLRATDYFAIPKESVLLCKNGKIKDNSYIKRNKILRYAILGAKIPASAIFLGGLFLSTLAGEDGEDAAEIFVITLIASTAVTIPGAFIGFTAGFISVSASGDEVTSEILEECEEYYTPVEELMELKYFSCPIEEYR